LAAGFCPKNLAFARKIMALPESGALQPPQNPGLYAYVNEQVNWSNFNNCLTTDCSSNTACQCRPQWCTDIWAIY